MIYKTFFIAFWKKEVMVPHSVFDNNTLLFNNKILGIIFNNNYWLITI